MRVADEGRVVPPGNCPVKRRPDARIRLCADDHETPDVEAGQHRLEIRVLERVAVVFRDERLALVRC